MRCGRAGCGSVALFVCGRFFDVSVSVKALPVLLPERIGELFHDPKPARYEKQIADLQGIIADKDKRIGQLQQEIKIMQAGHGKEKDEIKQRMYEAVDACR